MIVTMKECEKILMKIKDARDTSDKVVVLNCTRREAEVIDSIIWENTFGYVKKNFSEV